MRNVKLSWKSASVWVQFLEIHDKKDKIAERDDDFLVRSAAFPQPLFSRLEAAEF